MDEMLIFAHAVEGLFINGLRGRITPRLQARLKSAGLDLSKPLQPTYSREAWGHFVNITVEELYPGVPREEAFEALGECVINGFRETIVGRAALTLVRALGPRRVLHRYTHTLRSANNFIETELTERSPSSFGLWVNETRISPHLMLGILKAVMQETRAKNLEVAVESFDGRASVYRVQWEA